MAKDTFYFSHDYNSRNDAKIKKLLSKHGYIGYGVFWAIIEDLYNNANALPTDYDTISYDLRTDKNLVESIINDFDLFVFENGFFGSLSVQKRLEQRNEKSVKARESALKRWGKDANALPTESEPNAINKRKVNKRKVNKRKLIPEWIEFLTFAISKKPKVDVENLKLKYDSWIENDWSITRGEKTTKIGNWKSTLLNTLPYIKEKSSDKKESKIDATINAGEAAINYFKNQ